MRKTIPMYPFVGWRIPDSSGGIFIQLVVATALVACSDAHIDNTVVGQCPDTDVDVLGIPHAFRLFQFAPKSIRSKT